MMLELKVNGKLYSVDASPDSSLLHVLRESLGLTGIKFGCGMALCGACTVYLDGKEVRSCITPVSYAIGKEVMTIVAVAAKLDQAAEESWIPEVVPQSGWNSCVEPVQPPARG